MASSSDLAVTGVFGGKEVCGEWDVLVHDGDKHFFVEFAIYGITLNARILQLQYMAFSKRVLVCIGTVKDVIKVSLKLLQTFSNATKARQTGKGIDCYEKGYGIQ